MFRFTLSLLCLGSLVVSPAESASPTPLRPVALVSSQNGADVLIADASQGRLLRVNLATASVTQETKMADRLVDLVIAGPHRLLTADADSRHLILCRDEQESVEEIARVKLDLDPRRIAVSQDDRLICVTGRWAQSVQPVRLRENVLKVLPRIDVGFETHELLALDEHRFLVADAFGGRLAVVDAESGKVDAKFQLNGQNVRGLALSDAGSSVWVSHQILSRLSRSDFDDIHWGNLMQNVVTRIPTATLKDKPENFRSAVRQIPLGDTGSGFADPTGLFVSQQRWMVLSGGARKLDVYEGNQRVHSVATGRRPTRMISVGDSRFIVLNEHETALTCVTVGDTIRSHPIEVAGVTVAASAGEVAFYDAGLSHDAWMSCNSCHVDGHTPGSLADTLGDGAFGNPKRIPSLLGGGGTAPFGWLGNKPNLSEQIKATLATTMHGKAIPEETTHTLAEFVRQLPSPPSLRQRDADVIDRGRELFTALHCNGCHRPPEYTTPSIQDVGLRDELGNDRFNPPSLRGLRFRRVFFHDGRARSLSSIFVDHQHQIPKPLSPQELRRLLAYLQSL